MKVLIAGLAYGNRPKDILNDNLTKAGYPYTYIEINTEGIANAMNEAIDIAGVDGYDAISYLANDII